MHFFFLSKSNQSISKSDQYFICQLYRVKYDFFIQSLCVPIDFLFHRKTWVSVSVFSLCVHDLWSSVHERSSQAALFQSWAWWLGFVKLRAYCDQYTWGVCHRGVVNTKHNAVYLYMLMRNQHLIFSWFSHSKHYFGLNVRFMYWATVV